MKRFIGYLILCVSILVAVFVGFVPTFYGVNASADYDNGREYIYQVTLKQDQTSTDNYINYTNYTKDEQTLSEDIDDIVDEFKNRLETANISNAVVEKVDGVGGQNNGENEQIYTIRVAYKAQYEQLYSAVNELLTFDRNLSIATIQDSETSDGNFPQNDSSGNAQLFNFSEITADFSTGSPRIRIPLANPQYFYDTIYTPIHDANSSSSDSSDTSDDTAKETTPDSAYIYIVNDWKTSYSIESAVSSDTSGSYATDAVNNVLYRLDTTNPAGFFDGYEEGSESEEGYSAIFIDNTQFLQDLNNVNDTAVQQRLMTTITNLEVAKLTSTPYEYNITLLNVSFPSGSGTTNIVPAFIEQLKQYGTLTFSSLIIATLIAFFLISAFMALNYGISALSGISLTSGVLLLSAFCMSFFGVEFNIGTILALICVAVVSIFTTIVYYRKVRETCYSGKNLKKANQEASKRTIMYQLDISVILIIIGVVGYLFSNTVVMSMGAVFILGGIFNFILNAICLRGIYWLLANSSFINSHLGLLRIKKELIPDLSKDEKATYFDSYKEQKVNKKQRLIPLIVSSILLVGSLIAIPTVNAVKGNIYGQSTSNELNTQIVISYETQSRNAENGFATASEIENEVLNNIYVYNSGTEETPELISYTSGNIDIMYYSKIAEPNDSYSTYYFTYIINLDEIYSNDQSFIINNDLSTSYSLQEAVNQAINNSSFSQNISDSLGIYSGVVTNYTDDTLTSETFIFSLISFGIITIYVLIRYGLGKAIISFIYATGIGVISIGICSMLQVGLASTNTLAIVLIAIIGYSILLYYYYKEREVLKDNAQYIKTVDDKKDFIRLSHFLSLDHVLYVSGLALILLISFLFATTFTNVIIISGIVGLFFAFWLMSLLEPSERICQLTWSKTKALIHFERKNKKKKTIKKESDGPQEAIFIGIND